MVPEKSKNFLPGSISIKEDIEEKPEEKELIESFNKESEEYKNAKPVEQDALREAWNAMTASVPEDQPDLRSTLISALPKPGDDFVLEFEVKNDIQRNKIDARRNELVPVLRQKLQNRFITLKVVVKPDVADEDRKPVTPTEKFNSLAAKNSALIDLQKKFGLEPNY